MATRRGGRKLALDVLYEQEISDASAESILGRYEANPAYEFAAKLVRGVSDYREELDSLISENAQDWALDRMPMVDRTILRIAGFEILFDDDSTPAPVAINEAVELAKIYSTEDSGRFINGMLARMAISKLK